MKLKSFSDLRTIFPHAETSSPAPGRRDADAGRVRIYLETKGRKGKTVTVVSGLGRDPATMREIARALKEKCGTGGTVKNGNIELQGDQRGRAADELKKLDLLPG